MCTLRIYSQNISGDKNSEKLVLHEEMKNWTFENRIKRIFKEILKFEDIDIIALNEVIFNFLNLFANLHFIKVNKKNVKIMK